MKQSLLIFYRPSELIDFEIYVFENKSNFLKLICKQAHFWCKMDKIERFLLKLGCTDQYDIWTNFSS